MPLAAALGRATGSATCAARNDSGRNDYAHQVIGGTGFIGSHVLRCLLDGGHEVLVFHRGQAETSSLPSTIRHILGDRNALPSFATTFRQFSPQALDVMPYSEQDAITVIETLRGITERVVALSSQDVYRAYGLFTGLEEGSLETTPYDEEAPLRSKLYPYRALAKGRVN